MKKYVKLGLLYGMMFITYILGIIVGWGIWGQERETTSEIITEVVTNVPVETTDMPHDLNHDGTVDIIDYSIAKQELYKAQCEYDIIREIIWEGEP